MLPLPNEQVHPSGGFVDKILSCAALPSVAATGYYMNSKSSARYAPSYLSHPLTAMTFPLLVVATIAVVLYAAWRVARLFFTSTSLDNISGPPSASFFMGA